MRAKRRSPFEASRRKPTPRDGEELENLLPRNGEQRPDDAVRALLARAGEARGSTASLPGHPVRLGDVVVLVGRRDERRSGLPRHVEERLVAHVAGRRLDRKAQPPRGAPGVDAALEEEEAEPAGMLRDEGAVAVGLAGAEAVVDVPDRQPPAGLRHHLGRGDEERHRVGAARDGEEDRRARRHQSLLGGLRERATYGTHRLYGSPYRPPESCHPVIRSSGAPDR